MKLIMRTVSTSASIRCTLSVNAKSETLAATYNAAVSKGTRNY